MNIQWPWTSRARLDDAQAQIAQLRTDCEAAITSVEQEHLRHANLLVEQITFLRQQNTELLDHVKRVDRARHGMTETVHEPREAVEPMPKALDAYYSKLDNQPLAQERRRQAYRRRGKGESWEQIMQDVLPPPEPNPEPAP